jgi:hypothetical protein
VIVNTPATIVVKPAKESQAHTTWAACWDSYELARSSQATAAIQAHDYTADPTWDVMQAFPDNYEAACGLEPDFYGD